MDFKCAVNSRQKEGVEYFDGRPLALLLLPEERGIWDSLATMLSFCCRPTNWD